MPPPGPARRRRGLRLLFALLTTVGALAVGEGLARLLLREAALATIPSEVVAEHIRHANAYTWDARLGWRRAHVPHPALGVESHSFRHAPVDLARPPGRLRGFVMGDSQTFGAGVDAGQDYPGVAERILRERGLEVEVINAAVSGYKSIQVLRWFEDELLAFDPQFLVVDCIPADVHDVREERPDWAGPLGALLFRSRLYRGLRLVVEELRPGAAHPMRDPKGPDPDAGSNHDHILALGEAHGVEVFFLDYPFWGEPVRAMAPAERLPPGARSIDSVGALRASGRPTGELFHDNNHLSVLGNAIVGEALADGLEPCLRALAAGRGCPTARSGTTTD